MSVLRGGGDARSLTISLRGYLLDRQHRLDLAAAVEMYRKMRDEPNPPAMWFPMDEVLARLPVALTSMRAWVEQHRAAFER